MRRVLIMLGVAVFAVVVAAQLPFWLVLGLSVGVVVGFVAGAYTMAVGHGYEEAGS